jgi:hypothetical protein
MTEEATTVVRDARPRTRRIAMANLPPLAILNQTAPAPGKRPEETALPGVYNKQTRRQMDVQGFLGFIQKWLLRGNGG